MRQILLIRHGATALNSNDHTVDRIRGWSDWELSEQGKDEAHKLAEMMFDNPPDMLVCSDLKRAVETTRIICGFLGVPAQKPTMDFRPWDVGIFVGAQASRAIPQLAKYAGKWPDKAVPGGESFISFRTRFMGGLTRALDYHKGVIGIVTHHRCERLMQAWAKAGYDGAIDQEEFTRKGETTGTVTTMQVPFERLSVFWRRPRGEMAGVG